MNFQDTSDVILWNMHFRSSPQKVFDALTTNQGRAKYWAESTEENDGHITFHIYNYPPSTGRILAKESPHFVWAGIFWNHCRIQANRWWSWRNNFTFQQISNRLGLQLEQYRFITGVSEGYSPSQQQSIIDAFSQAAAPEGYLTIYRFARIEGLSYQIVKRIISQLSLELETFEPTKGRRPCPMISPHQQVQVKELYKKAQNSK